MAEDTTQNTQEQEVEEAQAPDPVTVTELAKLKELTTPAVIDVFVEKVRERNPEVNAQGFIVAVMNQYQEVNLPLILSFAFSRGLLALGQEDMAFLANQEDIMTGLLPELLRRIASEGGK